MKQQVKNLLKRMHFLYALFIRLNDKVAFTIVKLKKLPDRKKQLQAFRSYQFSKNEAKVFLLGIPNHSNLGDQAQTYCTLKWLNENYPNHKVYSFSSSFLQRCDYLFLKNLKKYLTDSDRIFIQSGYNTTDLYLREENLHRAVLKIFKSNLVIVLPQTVYFVKQEEAEKTEKIYNSHKKLIFFARDSVSFEKAKEMFPDRRVYLYPDIVTSLIGKYKFCNERSGILMCMRNDIESLYSKAEMKALADTLSSFGQIDFTDTTLSENAEDITSDREKFLFDTFNSYSKYKLIITDRYHGTIFSLISGTPVIVVNSSDHKLSSGVTWFDKCDAFNKYVYLCNSLDVVYPTVEKIMQEKLTYSLPDYFDSEYYSKLYNLIESK